MLKKLNYENPQVWILEIELENSVLLQGSANDSSFKDVTESNKNDIW